MMQRRPQPKQQRILQQGCSQEGSTVEEASQIQEELDRRQEEIDKIKEHNQKIHKQNLQIRKQIEQMYLDVYKSSVYDMLQPYLHNLEQMRNNLQQRLQELVQLNNRIQQALEQKYSKEQEQHPQHQLLQHQLNTLQQLIEAEYALVDEMYRGVERLEEFAVQAADILLETDGLSSFDTSSDNNSSDSGTFSQPGAGDTIELTEANASGNSSERTTQRTIDDEIASNDGQQTNEMLTTQDTDIKHPQPDDSDAEWPIQVNSNSIGDNEEHCNGIVAKDSKASTEQHEMNIEEDTASTDNTAQRIHTVQVTVNKRTDDKGRTLPIKTRACGSGNDVDEVTSLIKRNDNDDKVNEVYDRGFSSTPNDVNGKYGKNKVASPNAVAHDTILQQLKLPVNEVILLIKIPSWLFFIAC